MSKHKLLDAMYEYSILEQIVSFENSSFEKNCIGIDEASDDLNNIFQNLWFFISVRKIFSDNTRVSLFIFCRAKREIFFHNSTLGYMTKTLNQIIFFFSTKIRIFFSAKLGIGKKP
jgi:hypothetical protein